MRDRWLNTGAVFAALSALLLAIPASAQTQSAPPPPSLTQSPGGALPDASQFETPNQPAAPSGPAAAPAQSPAAPQPAAQEQTPEKAKAKSSAQAKKAAKSKSAKAKPPSEMGAPAGAAPSEMAAPGGPGGTMPPPSDMGVPANESAAPAEAAPPSDATAPAAEGAAPAEPVAKTRHAEKSSAMAKMDSMRAPRDIVVGIYGISAGKDGSYSGPSAFDNERIRQRYFSKSLIAAIGALQAKSAGEPILNFDPITNSEGPDVQDLDIALEAEQPDHVSVAAKFKSADDSSIVHYDFVKEGKAWKLDDIRGEIIGQSGQWSLREIIKNSLQRS
jgi:hypothetical protein